MDPNLTHDPFFTKMDWFLIIEKPQCILPVKILCILPVSYIFGDKMARDRSTMFWSTQEFMDYIHMFKRPNKVKGLGSFDNEERGFTTIFKRISQRRIGLLLTKSLSGTFRWKICAFFRYLICLVMRWLVIALHCLDPVTKPLLGQGGPWSLHFFRLPIYYIRKLRFRVDFPSYSKVPSSSAYCVSLCFR